MRASVLLLFVSACTAAPSVPAPGPAQTGPAETAPVDSAPVDSAPVDSAPVEVADGRRVGDDPDVRAWESDPAALEAIAEATPNAEAVGRAPLHVVAVAEGSFTRSGARQSAVLFADGLGTGCCSVGGIAVVEDGRLVRNVATPGGYRLRRLPDLDGDGRDELAVSYGFTNMGTTITTVSVGEIGQDGLEEWGALYLYQDDCGVDGDGPRARRLVALPGRRPTFSAEHYEGACDGGDWASVGPLRPIQLVPPGADPSADPWAR